MPKGERDDRLIARSVDLCEFTNTKYKLQKMNNLRNQCFELLSPHTTRTKKTNSKIRYSDSHTNLILKEVIKCDEILPIIKPNVRKLFNLRHSKNIYALKPIDYSTMDFGGSFSAQKKLVEPFPKMAEIMMNFKSEAKHGNFLSRVGSEEKALTSRNIKLMPLNHNLK